LVADVFSFSTARASLMKRRLPLRFLDFTKQKIFPLKTERNRRVNFAQNA
jgi:hypothetical protein